MFLIPLAQICRLRSTTQRRKVLLRHNRGNDFFSPREDHIDWYYIFFRDEHWVSKFLHIVTALFNKHCPEKNLAEMAEYRNKSNKNDDEIEKLIAARLLTEFREANIEKIPDSIAPQISENLVYDHRKLKNLDAVNDSMILSEKVDSLDETKSNEKSGLIDEEPESTEIPKSPSRQARKRKKSKSTASSSFETNEPTRRVRKRARNDSTTIESVSSTCTSKTNTSNRSLTQHEFTSLLKQEQRTELTIQEVFALVNNSPHGFTTRDSIIWSYLEKMNNESIFVDLSKGKDKKGRNIVLITL